VNFLDLSERLHQAIKAAGTHDLLVTLPLSVVQALYQSLQPPAGELHDRDAWWCSQIVGACDFKDVSATSPIEDVLGRLTVRMTGMHGDAWWIRQLEEAVGLSEIPLDAIGAIAAITRHITARERERGELLTAGRRLRELTGKTEGIDLIEVTRRDVMPAAKVAPKRPELCYRNQPLAECAAGGGDCDGCADERLPGGPGMQGAEIRAAARGTLAEQLWRACDAWEKALARPAHPRDGGLEKRMTMDLATVIRQIREHAEPEQLFARTDIAQVVGRLVALEAAVFDKRQPAWEHIRSAEHKAIEEASVVLAGLAPGLGSASLKAQAESISDRFAALSPLVGAVAQWPITTQGIDPALTRAYRRAKQALHGFQPLRMSQLIEQIERIIANLDGVISTPPRRWTKRALHNLLQAVKRDLERASGAQTGLT